MSTITTTSEKINEALKQKGTIQGKGKNKIITWNVIEDNNFLYRISMSLRSGKIRIEKFIDNEEYINFGRTIIYRAEYEPESDSFQIGINEIILNNSHNGEYTENKYFLSKDHGCLVKKYNDIIVTEYLVGGGGKNFSYSDYDLNTMQENNSFSCNLNPDNEFVNGKYSSQIGKNNYVFDHGICKSPTAHIYVNGKKIQKFKPIFRKLDYYTNYLKYKVQTGSLEIDFFIGYFMEEIAEAVKKNPEGYEGTVDNINVKEKLLLEFDEQLRVKLKTLALKIPFCELYQRINNSLSTNNGQLINYQNPKETGPILQKKRL